MIGISKIEPGAETGYGLTIYKTRYYPDNRTSVNWSFRLPIFLWWKRKLYDPKTTNVLTGWHSFHIQVLRGGANLQLRWAWLFIGRKTAQGK